MAKASTKLVSLGTIAQLAGVSRMAVSKALRNHPGVSKETRARILRLARKLHYTPDARLATWMHHVRGSKKRESVAIAWLNTTPDESCWRKLTPLRPYLEGAEKRCAELGYHLESFWVHEPGMTNRHLSQILYQRGIQGVLITPPYHRDLGHIRLNWPYFACATFERAMPAPGLHQASQDYYYNLMLAIKRLRRLGYRRIGFVIPDQTESRSLHGCSAAIAYYHTQIPAAQRIPLLTNRDEVGPEFDPWIKRHRPEVVVGLHSHLTRWIERTGHKVPREIGAVHLALEDDCKDWAGIWANKREIGAAAAGQVILQLQNHQFGLPEHAHTILIQGTWQMGKTLRPADNPD